MSLITFKNLPDTSTPINASNLNGNFEELGVNIGTTVNNGYRTNILYNKNLLNEVTLTNGYRLNSSGGLINQNGWSTTDYIEVEENTAYIINITRISEFHRICFYNNSKNFLSKDETLNATFTTPANTKYIRFSSYTTDFSGGILQKGSLFTIPSIVVDNEKIYNKNNVEQYSTTEQRIGTWIDGKPIYRKVITGTLTGTTQTGIGTFSNISLLFVRGRFFYGGNTLFFGVSDNQTALETRVQLTSANVLNIYHSSDVSGSSYELVIEYTKTTD